MAYDTTYDDPNVLRIRELNIDTILPTTRQINKLEHDNESGSKIIVIGKTGTGKSTLIANLLYYKKHILPCAVAFSGSEDSNGFFKKIIPSTFIFNEYDEDKLKQIIKRQKIAKQHLPNPWCAVVLDDCTDDRRIFNRPLQQAIFKRSRHWSMIYIVALQYSGDMPPAIRNNVDGVFILREPILANRKRLFDNYASVIGDFAIFNELLDQLTDDFGCLYIANFTRSNRWQDCVFYYRATPIPSGWKLGCPEFHQFHNERYNTEYIDNYDTI